MESITALIQIPFLFKFAVPTLAAIFIALFWIRAGSIHAIFERLWRLAAGKTELKDPVLKRFIEENNELEKFNFLYGLKAETKSKSHQFVEWIDRNGLSVASVQKARCWVNLNSEEIIKSPKQNYFVLRILFVILYYCIGVASIVLSVHQSALLHMKTSTVYFLIDDTSIRGFSTPNILEKRWSIDLQKCEMDPSEITKVAGFTKDETTTLCHGIKDSKFKKFISETVSLQQNIGIISALFTLIVFIKTILQLSSASEARRIVRQVSARQGLDAISPGLSQKSDVAAEIKSETPRRQSENKARRREKANSAKEQPVGNVSRDIASIEAKV